MANMERRVAGVVSCALALTGCATGVDRLTGDTPLERYSAYAGEPVDRFTAFNVTGWTALSRNKLVVWTGVSDAHLLTVWDTCRDLEFADRVRITRTGSSISRFDKVIVRGDRCPITEIRPIDVKQMRADREAAKVGSGLRLTAAAAPRTGGTRGVPRRRPWAVKGRGRARQGGALCAKVTPR